MKNFDLNHFTVQEMTGNEMTEQGRRIRYDVCT